MSTSKFGDIEIIKLRHIWVCRNCQHSFPRSWYASIQATSIVQFQLEDFEFITKLNEQLLILYLLKAG